jgi:tetratricopeptide (TPR) repeat protein
MSEQPVPVAPFFSSPQARRLAWLCAVALVLAALALNMRTLGFGFLYLRDDDVNVALNPHMGGLSAERLRWMFTDFDYVRRYIPLGWLGFSATYGLSHLDPMGYHALALALYGANCALVLLVLLQFLRFFLRGAQGGLGPWCVASAALAAGWWAAHPFRVETTAWVSGNLYGQSVALLLCALAAYMQTYARGPRRAAWLAASAVLFAASLLTYPLALGVPVLMVGMDWLRGRLDPAVPLRRLLAEKALFFVPVACVLAVTLVARVANAAVFGAVPGMRDLSLASRAAQSAYVAAYYVWKPWWPSRLSPLYDTLVAFRPSDWPFLASAAAVAAASVLALLWVRRAPALAVGWFGYLAVAAPFFGLTEKPHITSDRYGCLLMVIMAAPLAAGVARLSRAPARACAAALSLGLIAVLGVLSWRQQPVWSSDLYQHAYVARGITNAELLDDFTSRKLILEFIRGDEEHASRAVAARLRENPAAPGYAKAAAIIADKRRIGAYYGPVSFMAILHDQMGLKFAREASFQEADDHFGEALRQDDRFYQAAFDRALVLLRLGRSDDALDSFLLSERWAPAGLPRAERHEFLARLEAAAQAEGRPALAAASRAAQAR